MASVDGWRVAFDEARGDWYHVRAGDKEAYMRSSDLCFTRPWAYVNALATRAASPNRTATPAPGEIVLGDDLSPDERRMILDGLQHLKNCVPPLYDYVRTYVREIHRGSIANDKVDAWVRTGTPIVYLPEKGSVNSPERYTDSMRTFSAAALLVHEARHLEMGKKTTEPDAYRFELQVFVPQCKPNDIGNSPWNLYIGMRQYVEWRASLPFPGEPPEDAIPQGFR
jgi:hypothetical protein